MDFETRHPYYNERMEAWEFAKAHWQGGRALRKRHGKYLAQFQLEQDKEFKDRADRATGLYDNLVKRALHVYQSQLNRVKPERTLPSTIEAALDDADLFGTSADAFFQSVEESAQVYEWCAVLVDAPRAVDDTGQLSERDAAASSYRPWFERIDPLQVIDWSVEMQDPARRGSLNYIVIRDEVTREKVPFAEGRKVVRYRCYEPHRIRVWEHDLGATGDGKNATPVVDMTNAIGEVPIVVFYEGFQRPMQGRTVIEDVALAANALWNSASVADESYYYQGFNLLVLSTDRDVNEIKMKENRGFTIGPGERAEYLAPSPVPFEAHERRAQSIIERVRDLVFNRTSRQLATAQVESAEKRDIDRQEFLSILESKAESFERAEEAAWRLLALAWGADEGDIEVRYNRNFTVDTREADEWVKLVAEGVMSKAEWYMALHPDTDAEQAWEEMRENIAANEELNETLRATQRARETVVGVVGEGDEDEEAAQTTGPGPDGHTHTIAAGASVTSTDNGHAHTVRPGANRTGEANGHAHSIPATLAAVA